MHRKTSWCQIYHLSHDTLGIGMIMKVTGYSRYFSRHVQEHRDNGRVVIAIDDESHFYQPLSEVFYVFCKLLYSLQTWKETGMAPFNPHTEEGSKGQVDLANIFCRFAYQPGRVGNRMIRHKYYVVPGRQNGKRVCLMMQASCRTSGSRYLLCIYSMPSI